MKKRILLFVMVVTMLVSAVVFAINSSAACSVVSSGKNIAKDANIIASSDAAYIYTSKLVDGNGMTGTWTGGGSFTFVFAEDKPVSSVGLAINGYMTGDDNGYPTPTPWTYQQGQITVGRVKVQFLSANDEVIWDSGELNTSSTTTTTTPAGFAPYMVNSVDIYKVRKVVIHIFESSSQWGKTPIGEVCIYEGSGAHDWALDTSVSTTEQPYIAADCVNNGMGTYKCTCGARKYDVIYSTGHEYGSYAISPTDPTKHATICLRGSEGKCSEAAGTLFNVADHVYDNECDTTCNVCPATRTVEPHTYVSDCDVHCNKCDALRAPVGGAQHSFPYACTVECENCREPNPNRVDHTYTSDCDATCNYCQLERTVSPHVYESECDEVCNVVNCGYERNTVSDPTLIPHTYTSDCDTHCNNENCTHVRQPLMEHPFKNKCDKNCDKCNELNPNYVEGHFYDHDCDIDCNECKQKRSVDDHKYDNVCDIDCNVCHAQRVVSKHIYADWITLVPATESSDGMRAHYCVNCDKEETEVLPMIVKEGLGTGVVVAIVVGCVVVIGGCTAIGIYSLVIKPKMETKKRLEAEAAKKKAEEDEYEDDEEEK